MLSYIAYAAILSTLIVLVIGIVLMAIGNKVNDKYSNKLMALRVGLQAIAILLLMIAASTYETQ